MAATVATLMGLGWHPGHPTFWKDERGDEWDIGCASVSLGELKTEYTSGSGPVLEEGGFKPTRAGLGGRGRPDGCQQVAAGFLKGETPQPSQHVGVHGHGQLVDRPSLGQLRPSGACSVLPLWTWRHL